MWERIWTWLDAIWWEMRPKAIRDLERGGWPADDAAASEGMSVYGGRSHDDGPCEDEEDDAA